ncbi:uncharacterized protein LOC116605524 [Nematostella vectensis]|uniref:uncharacterized protein LOC116605524 n=1 Tax=Nematostella vectensis TaxID=45351 RepID=UPI002076EC60|nr:uncharacterized protein LOC116605524 [Nematostella vectensis]
MAMTSIYLIFVMIWSAAGLVSAGLCVSDNAVGAELVAVEGGHCACHKAPTPSCGCCARIKFHIWHFKIDNQACVSTSLLSSTPGLEIQVTWDGKAIFKKDITVKNPPPLCFDLPLIHAARACLVIDKISLEPHHHGACAELEIKLFHTKKKFKIGCFYGNAADMGGIQDKLKRLEKKVALHSVALSQIMARSGTQLELDQIEATELNSGYPIFEFEEKNA